MYTALDTTPKTTRSLAESAYVRLKHQVLLGEFPLGRRMAEVAIAEQLEVSRTPVRDALARLHAEGLVVRLPEGGFSPSAPDLHTVRELYEVRRGLELTALHADDGHDRTRLESILDDWKALREIRSSLEAGPDFVLQDEDFHVRLAESSGNRSLVDLLTHVNERIRFVRMHDFLTEDRLRQTIDEHISIVQALLSGNLERTEARLLRHLSVSRQVVEQRAALALSRMVSRDRGAR